MPTSKELFDKKVQVYKQVIGMTYKNAYPEQFAVPDNITQVLAMIKQYEGLVTAHAPKKPIPFKNDILDQLKAPIEPKKAEYANKLKSLDDMKRAKIQALVAQHTNQVTEANNQAKASVEPLKAKHATLMSYKDKIEDICKRYGITPTEIQMADDLSAEEYDNLLTAAIQGCEKMTKTRNAKFNPLSLLYKPMEWSDSPLKQVIAITLFAIFFHNFGGVIAIVFFVAMYMSTIGIYKDIDKLKIAESMMYTPNFDKFMDMGAVEAVPNLDVSGIETEYQASLEALKKEDPEAELSAIMQEYNTNLEYFAEEQKKAEEEANQKYMDVFKVLQERLEKLKKAKAEILSKMKHFGDSMLDETPHCYPTYNYVMGMIDNTIEQRVMFPKTSCTFAEVPGMRDFIKLITANTLLDMKEKKQRVIIVDPNDLGKDFAEFLSQEKTTKDLIQVCTDKADEVIKKLRDTVTQNIRVCGNKTLDEINKDAEEKGMVTYDYTLLILLSGCEKFLEDEANMQLIKNGHNYGLRIFYMHNTAVPGLQHFSKPYELQGITAPFRYSYELGVKVTETFANAVANSKDGAIDYFTSIQEKYIPREKWGTWSSNKGIELNFGLAGGDPSKGYPMKLDDGNVHFLMAGQSGAGKSAAINQMLLSLLCKYTPRELMLVMIDFKNVEFSTFTKPDPKSDGKLSIIPHAKIMAGTKDGEYALSIFDFLIGEMERRQKVFGAVQQKKLEDYNNLMREQGHPEKCMPRILLLIDEFQVMFTEVDRKIVDLIQDRIRSLAKLARAFGCHMWFTSQSMSGTMSNDVKANFSLRAALRCTKEVSTEIIGNGAAGDIKAKFGYLITNDSTGQDPTRNTLWRVPFVSTKNILKTIAEVNELYEGQGMKGYDAPFYDEDQLHKDKELFQFYEDHKDNPKVTNPHLFVLGMRTNFSLNTAPVNFYIDRGDFENVIIGGMEDHDLLNMTRTIMDNIQVHGLKMIVSCADDDAHKLLELDERLKGGLLKWSYPTIEFTDWVGEDSPLTAVINKRQNAPDEDYPPLAVILYNWDKYPGFGVSENTRALGKMKEYLRIGPSLDIHFYLIIKTKAELSMSVFTLFKHKIAALLDEGTSYRVIDNGKANKLPNSGNFAIYRRGNEEFKFKILQHEFNRKLADKELQLQ